jgi:hypothetical protein
MSDARFAVERRRARRFGRRSPRFEDRCGAVRKTPKEVTVVRGSKVLALLVLVAGGLLGYAAASGKLKPADTPVAANRVCDDATLVGCCASGDGRAALLTRAADKPAATAPVQVAQPKDSK